MGIKGTVYAIPPPNRLESMEVGDIGYLHAVDLIVTREALFIDRISEVINQEEYEDPEEGNEGICVVIERIGPNFTQDDFEIDVSILEDYDFNLEGKGAFLENSAEKDRYLVFPSSNFELEIIKKLRISELSPKQKLMVKLDEAVKKQDYKLAAEIRDELSNLEKDNE